MVTISRLLKRIACITTSVVVGFGTILVMPAMSASAAQVTARSIQMSSSSNAGSAATTAYNVKFTTTQTFTGRGIIIDFCANSPIIGDTTCTAPTGLSVASSTITTNTAPMNAQTWTIAAANTNRTVVLTQATGVSFTNATTADFTINLVQNPTSAVGTFYARIYVYDATAGATGYTVADPDFGDPHLDDGGVALSTASQVTVTAKVQETLLFCVYTGANCAAGVSGMVLGDTFGVLSSTTTNYLTSTNATTPLTAKIDLASNASGSPAVTVRAKSTGTLTSGANTIAATGSGAGTCTADSASAVTEQFGFRITAGTTNQTADAGYACSAGNHSFDTTNLTSTYGDPILTTTAASTATTAAVIDFMGKASTTTKSGVYTSTFTFIATGVY